MRTLCLFTLIALLGAAPPPSGGSVGVTVLGANGKPVANAVVIIRLIGRPTPTTRPGSGYQIRQQNIQFSPFLLVVPIESDVGFPNLDLVRHQVYSFSPAKRFELKLYAREQNRAVRFDKAGPVALGCNIHDQMTAFVYVTNSAFTAVTNGAGRVVLSGVPNGQISITVWQPYLRAPGNQVARMIALNGNADERFAVALRPSPAASGSY